MTFKRLGYSFIFLVLVLIVLPPLTRQADPLPTAANAITEEELGEFLSQTTPSLSVPSEIGIITQYCSAKASTFQEYEKFKQDIEHLNDKERRTAGEMTTEWYCADNKDDFIQHLQSLGAQGVSSLNTISFIKDDNPQPITRIVLGVNHKCANYTCAALYWYSSTGSTSQNFYAPYMPSGWDDEVSSAQSLTSHTWWHHEHSQFGGALVACSCTNMGIMDNKTSSLVWEWP